MNYDSLDEYQAETRRTMSSIGDEKLQLAVLALGLTGESGELADMIKKHLGHGHPLDKNKVIKEIGDVLWYAARLADSLKVPLSMVVLENVKKLRIRYPNGFSTEASLNRADIKVKPLAAPIKDEHRALVKEITEGLSNDRTGSEVLLKVIAYIEAYGREQGIREAAYKLDGYSADLRKSGDVDCYAYSEATQMILALLLPEKEKP